jgi:hypothetical protein
MSERGELDRLNAKAHKNSGRGMVKGDGSTDRWVIDIKEYPKGYRITPDAWAKICTDAYRVDRNKSPMLVLVIGEGNKKVRLAVTDVSEIIDDDA